MIRLLRHARGPRLYVVGCRVHHGTAGLGAVAAAAALRRRRRTAIALAITGVAVTYHDRRDFPFRDTNNH